MILRRNKHSHEYYGSTQKPTKGMLVLSLEVRKINHELGSSDFPKVLLWNASKCPRARGFPLKVTMRTKLLPVGQPCTKYTSRCQDPNRYEYSTEVFDVLKKQQHSKPWPGTLGHPRMRNKRPCAYKLCHFDIGFKS